MPQMTDERMRVGIYRAEDLSLLNEVGMNPAGGACLVPSSIAKDEEK